MTIKLSESDHRLMDYALDTILQAHRDGSASLIAAREMLAHIVTAAARGDEGSFRGFISHDTIRSWKEDLSDA